MIETHLLTKSFGARTVLEEVSVRFPPGAVTALLGRNGAGKSTLLRIVAGLDRPDRGTVCAGGGPSAPGKHGPAVGIHLGPEAMDPRHTVWRHLSWLAALAGVGRRRVAAVAAETGLDENVGDRIGRLSLGARQRVAIAGALLCQPRVVLFDEPLNGLDVSGIVWFRRLLRTLADDGTTVVVATHLLAEVALTADRVVILRGGRLCTSGALDEVVPAGADPRSWLEAALMESR
ncbi:ABC transporter ATP-binding protein [Mycolicibacterium palauense]|uniref:ABC transporter ATP-binding protein n=1 Tax=Mycolicibacterium palauense TaxID=2034511 RepID=UPI000BFEBBFF|nr:ABC transporter ATP-binding protein [Mycolicibacterium palauense]